MNKILLMLSIAVGLYANVVKLNLNAKYGAENFHTIGATKYAQKVKEYTNGEVLITVHAGSSLVKGNPLKAVKDATVAMTDMFLPFTSGGGKIFGITALPLLLKITMKHMSFIKYQSQFMKKS